MSSATREGESSVAQDSRAGAGFTASANGITPPSMPGRQGAFLSDVIVELGLAEREVVEEAVPEAASTGRTVGRFLIDNGVLDEDELSIAIAERSGLEHVDLDRFDVDLAAATLISRNAAMRYNALPIAFAPDGTLVVAVADPSDFLGISDIEVMARAEVRLAIANPERIRQQIEQLPEPPEPSPGAQANAIAILDELPAEDDQAEDEAAAAERDEERERLQYELNQIHSQLAMAVDQRDRLTDDRDRLGGERDELRGRLAEATDKYDELRSQLVKASEERDELQGQLSATTEERDQLRGQLSAASEERERLIAEAESVEAPPAEAEPPEPSVAVDQVTLDKKKGTATVGVSVEGAGVLLLTGKGVKESATAVAGESSATLDVVPTGKKRRKLKEAGKAKVAVSVLFVSANGELRTQPQPITLLKGKDR